jgi:hypothetical protein
VAACGWAEGVGRARDGKRGGVLGRKGRGEGLGVFGPKQMEGDVSPFFSFIFFYLKAISNSFKKSFLNLFEMF